VSAEVKPRCVVFDGPFRTGFRIDMQAILASQFRAWASLWAPGSRAEASGWAPTLPARRGNDLLFDIDDRHGAGRAAWIAARNVPAGHPLHEVAARILDPLAVEAVTVRLFDFGVASLTVRAAFPDDSRDTYDELLVGVEARSSALGAGVRPLLEEEVAKVDAFIPDAAQASAGPAGEEALTPPGVPLWMHRVLVVTAADGFGPPPGGAATGRPFPRPGHECFVVGERADLFLGGEVRVWVGHGTSVAECQGDSWRQAAGCVERVINASNAYFAGAHELGNLILERQHEVAHLRRSRNAKALQVQAFRIIDAYDELALFRALAQDHTMRLPLTDRCLTEAVNRSWRLDVLLKEIDRRRADLSEVHSQALRRLQAEETSRLNLVVFGLTMISAVQVTTDLIQFVQDDGLRSPDVLRFVLLVLVALVLALVAWRALGRGRQASAPEPDQGWPRPPHVPPPSP